MSWPRLARAFWAFGLFLALAAQGAEERWIKVSADHFTILTPSLNKESEPAAREWAEELEQFRRGLQAIVPVDSKRLRPVTVVLFPSDRAMEPYVPLERNKPARIGGLFVRANDINTIMLSSRDPKATRRLIFHEAVHWHLSAREGVMPLWLTEGLAELYSTFERSKKEKVYRFGMVLQEYALHMQERKLLPLTELLQTNSSSLLYNEGTRASIFYAQSWALAHYLFFGVDSPGRPAVRHYLAALETTRSPDEAFEAAFGADYPALEKKLRAHFEKGLYRQLSYPASTDDIQKLLKTGVASRAEIELAKGSLLLGTRSIDVAEPYLRRAAELAPEDPRAWELLGHIARERNDQAGAAALLEKAAAAGSTSYLVYHNLAVSRMPDTLIKGLRYGGLDPADMDAAAIDYRKAIRLATWHVPSYEGLAGLVYSMATFRPEDLDLLQQGLLQAPTNAMIEAGVAAAELRAGRLADGRARLEVLCARPIDSAEAGMKFARQMLAAETWKTDIAEIEWLGKQNRFAEVIVVVDRALARPLEPGQQRVLADLRQLMAEKQKISEAIAQINRGELPAGRQALETLLAEGPHPAARLDAERVLKELDRAGRGRP